MSKSNVIFVMNWPDDTGLMLRRARESYEKTAEYLSLKGINSFIAYPQVTRGGNDTELTVVEIDFNNFSKTNKACIDSFLRNNNIGLVIYIDRGFLWRHVRFFKARGIKVAVYCRYSQDYRKIARQPLKNFFKKILHKTRLLSFDEYIVISNTAKAQLIQIIGVLRDRVSLILNGIDSDRLLREIRNSRPYPFPVEKLVILSIFQLRPQKNILFILNVIKKLKEDRDDFIYCHVGSGQDMDVAKQYIIDNELDEICYLMGKEDSVFAFLKSSYLLIHACEDEAHGNVMTEAMLAGVKVLTVRSPGADEQINDTTGVIIESLNIKKFVDAANEILDKKYDRFFQMKQGLERINEKFSIEKQAKQLFDVVVKHIDPKR